MGKKPGAVRSQAVAPGIHRLPVGGCNVYLVGTTSGWALIDAGWPRSESAIRTEAESLFGPGVPPHSILLTHAHPDHMGSAATLSAAWEAPVFVHPEDLPYTRGGVLSDDLLDPVGRVFWAVARLLPDRAIARMNASPLKDAVNPLPDPEAGIPGLPGWECIHVPGHTPGHVVFFRRSDRVLVAGDAVLTAPLWGMLTVVPRLARPPWFVSWDWPRTNEGLATLAGLEPRVVATGHGVPLAGDRVAGDLAAFAGRFAKWPVAK